MVEAESLAVRFDAGADGPRQVVTRPGAWPMPLVDLTAEPDPRAVAETLMRAELDRPTPLFDGPLCQETLFRGGAGAASLVPQGAPPRAGRPRLRPHRTAGRRAVRRAGPASPSNFTSLAGCLADEGDYEASARAAVDREHWSRRFGKPYQAVNLAGRDPAPPWRRALRHSCYLPPHAPALAKALGASLPAIMTALLAHYLAQRTGAPEVILQLPVTGRLGPLARRATGVLANRVPLRLTVPPAAGPLDLVPQVVRELRALYRPEDVEAHLRHLVRPLTEPA